MQKITPNLWFNGNALEAVTYYLSVFNDGKILQTNYYPLNEQEGLPDFNKAYAGKILSIEFEILKMHFIAINANGPFLFNESVSFMISCKNQTEIDYYWNALTANGGAESFCGWLKDKYGISWQICPENWNELSKKPNAFNKLTQMKKIIIDAF